MDGDPALAAVRQSMRDAAVSADRHDLAEQAPRTVKATVNFGF